jgi:ectoine hydroxylase-related dioxygenase (phytanoyl-CoA dioxygenase family)
MLAVKAGEYETGVAPHGRMWNPGDSDSKLVKIDQPHLSDRTIYELVSHPALGRAAAALTGAPWVQAWAVQLLIKPATPPTTPGDAAPAASAVGWHQDRQYWHTWWTPESEVFTAWVAISDVTADAGPMRFVRGSHRWGFKNQGDFFGGDLDGLRNGIEVPSGEAWEEVPAILQPGGVSFHHRLTYHGSGTNHSGRPRLGFAVHVRTDRSRALDGADAYYTSHLDDPAHCPVIFGG